MKANNTTASNLHQQNGNANATTTTTSALPLQNANDLNTISQRPKRYFFL